MEGLARQMKQHGGVLAAGKQQHTTLHLGGNLAHDVDGLRLERTKMGYLVAHRVGQQDTRLGGRSGGGHAWRPHSVLS